MHNNMQKRSSLRFAHMYPMTVGVLILALGTLSLGAAEESPKEVAVRIIRSETPPAHNPLDNSERELNRAAVMNSRLRLKELMAGATVSDELRVCYALRVLDDRLRLVKALRKGRQPDPVDKRLLRDQELLAKYLRELQRNAK